MKDSRKKMLDKVRAILAKTMDNGCTEEEAMTALAKARELMATYEIDESELEQAEKEAAAIHRTSVQDPYNIKACLCKSVGRFTRCVGWGGKVSPVSFCGLESDVIFATWLLDTLQRFTMRALRDYQKKRTLRGMPNSNHLSASFVTGCINRIREKLKELTPVDFAKNKELIVAEMAKASIKLQKYTASREANKFAVAEGHKAGGSARFDKPVGQGGQLRLK